VLGEVIELKRGYDLPKDRRRSGDVPIVSSAGISGWHDEVKVDGPGVVTGRYGTIGETFYLTGGFWPLNTALYVRDFKGNDPRFVSYLLRIIDFDAVSAKSSVPGVNRNHLHAAPIRVPPVEQQRAIGEVLGALDDKIAANRKVVAVASSMSRGLARRDAAAGRDCTLGDVAELVTRGVAPRYADDGYAVLNQKCIRNGRVNIQLARRTTMLPKAVEKVLRRGDVLVNSTGQGTLGRVGPWTRDDVPVLVDTHISIVRVDPARADPDYVGTLLLHREADIEALAEGTTGQTELRRDALRALPLRLPALDVQRGVAIHLRSLSKLMDGREDEIERLAATRDELLPLLMSGRITVKDAERRVEEVV